LLLTPEQANARGLPYSIDVPGALADGSRVRFEARRCLIDWFGVSRPVLPIIAAGPFALIGIRLLEDLLLTIDYPARTVTLVSSTSDASR
jgi:hypothetical protein